MPPLQLCPKGRLKGNNDQLPHQRLFGAKTGQKERKGKHVSGRAEGRRGAAHELWTQLIWADPDLGSRLVSVDSSQGSRKHF